MERKAEGCSVCGMCDARALVDVELDGGTRVTLCGSHELMYRRAGRLARSIEELRANVKERRFGDRRACGGAEVDELAERLRAAFTNERRGRERRAS